MKLLFLFCIALLSVGRNGFHVRAQESFVRTRGTNFILNGSPFYANGFNAYWLMYMASDPSQRSKVTSAFQQASAHGLTIARSWAFSDGGYGALQYSPGVYNEQMFQGLDFVIYEARRHGIRLIFSLANNYDSFGGKKQYVQWARNQGQNLESDDTFFVNPVVNGYYKNHVKTILTRRNSMTGIAYKDDPTILAWELMNEARCLSDISGKTIQAWITEMAAYVKSIDSNHLLEAGLEGFYGESSPQKQQFNPGFQVGTDFIANNQIWGIDFATVHSYPDQCMPQSTSAVHCRQWVADASCSSAQAEIDKIMKMKDAPQPSFVGNRRLSGSNYETQLSFLGSWLNTHIQDAETILRKPLLLAEFGNSWKDPGFNEYQRDMLFNTVYNSIYASARRGGATVGGLFWQLLAEGMDSYRDGYEIVLTQNPSTVNIITQQSHKLTYLSRLFARWRNIEKLKRARSIRRAQWLARTRGKNSGN